jgi:hypothetical protein
MHVRKNVYAMRCFFRSMIPSNATPGIAIIDHVEGSGTHATASPVGWFSLVMKLG